MVFVDEKKKTMQDPSSSLATEMAVNEQDPLVWACYSHKTEFGLICRATKECEEVIKSKKEMREHLKGHRLYPCPVCEKVYNDRRPYRYHFKTMHETFSDEDKLKNPHSCHLCNARFTTEGGLNRHKSQMHSIKPSEKCDICLKTFSSVAMRRTHFNRSHKIKDQLQFLCKEEPENCNASFKASDSLKRHITRIHRDKQPEKEQCSSKERSWKCKKELMRKSETTPVIVPQLDVLIQ